MEIENDRFMAVFLKGQTLPNIQYDYTTQWNYPDWGNEGIPRTKSGYPISNTPDRFRVTPRMLDTRAFKVTTKTIDTADETTIDIKVDATVAQQSLALSVWDIPREYAKDAGRWKLSGAAVYSHSSAIHSELLRYPCCQHPKRRKHHPPNGERSATIAQKHRPRPRQQP